MHFLCLYVFVFSINRYVVKITVFPTQPFLRELNTMCQVLTDVDSFGLGVPNISLAYNISSNVLSYVILTGTKLMSHTLPFRNGSTTTRNKPAESRKD